MMIWGPGLYWVNGDSVCPGAFCGWTEAVLSPVLLLLGNTSIQRTPQQSLEVPGREIHQMNFRADTGGHHHPLENISVNRTKSSIFQITYPLQITPSTVIRNMPPSINKTHCEKAEFHSDI